MRARPGTCRLHWKRSERPSLEATPSTPRMKSSTIRTSWPPGPSEGRRRSTDISPLQLHHVVDRLVAREREDDPQAIRRRLRQHADHVGVGIGGGGPPRPRAGGAGGGGGG